MRVSIVNVGAIYEHVSGERFAIILLATDTTEGREGEHVVVYHRLGDAEILVKTMAEWCGVDANGRARFWPIEGG